MTTPSSLARSLVTALAFTFSAPALLAAPQTVSSLSITTWNLEHMMSEKTFDEWSTFCAKYDWDEDKVKGAGASATKPKHLTYCNAHNGLLYPTTVPESLPLHTRDAFAKKVAALTKHRAELNSDVFALQEVENEAAARRIFPEGDWHVIVTKAGIPQNIGYAVRKNGRARIQSSRQIDELAQVDDSGHRVRPGLEVTLEVGGKQLVLLNVHLKASCRSQPISAPTRPGYADDRRWEEIQQGCKVMRKQVPQLETWVEAQTRKNALYMIVGDWNRDLKRDLQLPARLTAGESPTTPITDATKIGSLLKEISDDEPKGDDQLLHVMTPAVSSVPAPIREASATKTHALAMVN